MNGCQMLMYPGSARTMFQSMPVSRLQPLAWSQRSAVPDPPLPLAVQTRPFGNATVVLYQRGSFMSGMRVHVLLRQSKMLERTVVARPPFTSTRPSGSVTSAPHYMSCEGLLYYTNWPVSGFHLSSYVNSGPLGEVVR